MSETQTRPSLTISEAAKLVGVSAATIRAWERVGFVVLTRHSSGRRILSLRDVDRLRRIKQLRSDGMSLSTIGKSLDRHEAETPDCGAAVDQGAAWRHQLRSRRLELSMSLREVSARVHLSPSFISSIERGLANPSLSSLQRLTATYGTTIVELFETPESTTRSLVRFEDRLLYPNVGGVSMEQLNFGHHLMELHMFTVAPGATTGDTYQHMGEEFILLLEGTLEVWLDEIERVVLNPGDVLYFESNRAHRWANPGSTPAVFLGVNTPKTF